MTPLFLSIAVGLSLLAALLIIIPLWRARGEEGKGAARLSGIIAVVIVLPLAVLSLYTQVSSYPWDKPERLTTPAPGSSDQIEMMMGQLAERMKAEPSAEGLTMLGRSYTVLERFADAAAAYKQAWELTEGKVPAITLNYAEALILADRDTLTSTAGDLLDQILTELPDDPKALWYGGLSASSRGNAALSQQRWVRLLNQPDIPDQLRQVVQQQLAALTDDVSAVVENTPDTAATQEDNTTGPVISITVTVASNLAGSLTGEETLYVYAREAGIPGPPVAVKRISAPVFPLQVAISDADVMLDTNSLEAVGQLELTARLSRSGNAMAESGDLFGEVIPQWPSESVTATVTINQSVP